MIHPHPSPLVKLSSQILKPFLLLFGLYVLFHGHESPGGGFQAGTILAAAMILEAIALGSHAPAYQRMLRSAYKLAALGLLIYAGTGALSLLQSWYLDYGGLPLPGVSEPERHWWGIFIVECGVCLVVMGSLVAIFDRLFSEERMDG